MQDPMSVLLCIQIVQTNNNESNWREKTNKQLFDASKPKKEEEFAKKTKKFNS